MTASTSAVGVVVALASLATACGGATSVSVPMTWRPSSPMEVSAFPGGTPQATIYVGAVTDKRERRKQIGENLEEGPPRPVFAFGEPTTFVRHATGLLFHRAGLRLVRDAASAERIVTVDLNTFWTQETDVYLSDINATYHVTDRSGRQLWTGTVSGASKTWGRSLKPENYEQVFSDGAIKMIERVLADAGFRNALQATGGQASGSP